MRLLGRIGVRLLVVNLIVLLVPIAGLEFARLYERQLLESLERDMRDQAALVRAHLEGAMEVSGDPEGELADTRNEAMLREAAKSTRTRVRVLDARGEVALDSHRGGPPEGEEGPAPSMLDRRRLALGPPIEPRTEAPGEKWPLLPDRAEVRSALSGSPSAMTRVRERAPTVILFLAEPVRSAGEVRAVVYVTRSTQPVLVEIYRIRSGIVRMLFVALLGTSLVTLLLAWSISRPLGRLSRAAKRVAAGELTVAIPRAGSGEIGELAEAFAQMKERLEARLRYISEFSADVAHEFKSPLTSIRGAAELLGEGASDDPVAKERFCKNIQLDVDRLDRLVSRLLLLSRVEASHEPMAPVDLVAIAERVALRSASVDQTVVVRSDGEAPIVRGREADLETAIANLVDNAVRHSPAGEAVDVMVSKTDEGALVRVVDRGPGVGATNVERVFERFYTTDPEGGGTGLGLAIVRAIAEAHGGSAHCLPGEGAVFELRLP